MDKSKPDFTVEQTMWLEDVICNKVLPRPMIMRDRYGLGQCGQCIRIIEALLNVVRKSSNDTTYQ